MHSLAHGIRRKNKFPNRTVYKLSMIKQLRYITGKSGFNLPLFLVIFFALYYGFYFYVGVVTPGGKTFSPFLYRYLNIPEWLSIAVIKCTILLLKIAGYPVYQKSANNVTIAGSTGVTIIWACLGMGVMVLWTAFIAAHKATLAYKLKWISIGIVSIYTFNVLRIVTILLSFKYHWRYPLSFDAHSTFNTFTYIITVVLMAIFIIQYNRAQKKL